MTTRRAAVSIRWRALLGLVLALAAFGGAAGVTLGRGEAGTGGRTVQLTSTASLMAGPTSKLVVSVPAEANIWLSGMPPGTTDVYGFDSVPEQAPVLVELPAAVGAGRVLTFTASGTASHGQAGDPCCEDSNPDGNEERVEAHFAGAENGIAGMDAPLNALVGVFLDDARPDSTPAPADVSFATAEDRDVATLSPLLKQPFVIGDGWRSDGSAQLFVVPQGATRLFLGMMDAYGWSGNSGSFSVQVDFEGATAELTVGDTAVVAGAGVAATAARAVAGPDGSTALLWQQRDGGSTAVRAQIVAADGSPQSPPFTVNTGAGDHRTPSGAFDADGNLLVVWSNAGTGTSSAATAVKNGVLGRRFAPSGEPLSGEITISTDVDDIQNPEADADRSGSAIVNWNDRGRTLARRLDPSGSPSGPAVEIAGADGEVLSSSVAMSSFGGTLHVWHAAGGGLPGIHLQRRAKNGAPTGDDQVVSESSTAENPAIGVADDGSFTVVWDDLGQSGRDIFARRFGADGEPLAAPFRINGLAAGDQTHARVDVNTQGDFAVVWESVGVPAGGAATLVEGSVLGRYFSSDGIPQTGDLAIAATEGGDRPERPDVSIDDADELEVTFGRRGSDERARGVFTRRVDVAASTASCVSTATSLCLAGERYRVTALFELSGTEATIASGSVEQLTGDSGYFWFFAPTNVEVVVKVLEACAVNGHTWVFAAGLTDVEVSLRVDDTATGDSYSFFNPGGRPFPPVLETAAFANCPGGQVGESRDTLAASARHFGRAVDDEVRLLLAARDLTSSIDSAGAFCASDADTLCLRDGRFQAELTFDDGAQDGGFGRQVALTSDTGYFWFFDPANVEVVVKVLDGCSFNDRFWVFAAGLTDVAARLTIRDTQSGAIREYENPGGQAFLPIQDTSAFAACP